MFSIYRKDSQGLFKCHDKKEKNHMKKNDVTTSDIKILFMILSSLISLYARENLSTNLLSMINHLSDKICIHEK